MLKVEPSSFIPTQEYHSLIQKMRDFFLEKNYLETATQSRLSILAACEDPFNVVPFEWASQKWPLPQTGQMWLEHELLSNPELAGVFCITTSYREEPNAIFGRHEKIFPMFEFESHGTIETLRDLEVELLEYLGFTQILELTYEEACSKFQTDTIENKHEELLCQQADGALLSKFPSRSDPFWNMKYAGGGLFEKIDVILMGQETIGSAERSTNPEEMRYYFDTVSDGKYRETLYHLFGKQRVEKELSHYFSHDFFPRFGAGIGITRLLRALKQKKLFL